MSVDNRVGIGSTLGVIFYLHKLFFLLKKLCNVTQKTIHATTHLPSRPLTAFWVRNLMWHSLSCFTHKGWFFLAQMILEKFFNRNFSFRRTKLLMSADSLRSMALLDEVFQAFYYLRFFTAAVKFDKVETISCKTDDNWKMMTSRVVAEQRRIPSALWWHFSLSMSYKCRI